MGSEKKYASVVVDIPAEKTDRPFDYEIPEALTEEVTVGCRVHVPFGSRTVQGYVVRVHGDPEVKKVRPIYEILDVIPPLNEELVGLAQWMSEHYFCRTVTAIEAMVPSVLKARYDRVLRLGPEAANGDELLGTEAEQRLMEAVAAGRGKLSLKRAEALPGVSRKLIRRLIQERRLAIGETVRDQTTRKVVTWVYPVANEELVGALDLIPKRARKQREVLDYFINRQKPVKLSQLLASVNTSRQTVERLVERGLLRMENREEYRDPYSRKIEPDTPPELTPEQEQVLQPIGRYINNRKKGTFLLHGVTGSGKTEVYLRAIDVTLRQGREAIVLVPEISLTPQMVERFKARFGERVAVLHSGLSSGERYDEWRKVLLGDVQVVIGARSAIFAPFRRLGLIVIDEEHETSYKQEESPRYHVRDVADRRADDHRAVVLLGSATPSVETYYRAKTGEMTYLSLASRVRGHPLPNVSVVDMRKELDRGNRSMFSRQLAEALTDCVDRGEQAVLFLNRRGYNTFVLCRSCGSHVECPHCDIALTYHRSNERMRCHYCGYTETVPQVCPQCGSQHIRYFGTGTQRVEQELGRRFPGLRVIRMDVDTTSNKGAHEKLFRAFREGRADVLLGTQMIAKGLDFPKVTLVGVIAADTTLGLPDFRSGERTFQLLMQVGGRAGRREHPGKVIIQTYQPDHYSIQMAANYEVTPFYRRECQERLRKQYPPFCSLVAVHFYHPDQTAVMKASHELTKMIQEHLGERASVLGPVKASIFRVKDRYHMQTVIKYKSDQGLKYALQTVQEASAYVTGGNQLRVTIDRDPYSLY